MSNETGEIATIRKYLLGDLPELEAERIERCYFADGRAVDEVWAAFGEMAEERLRGALPESEARRFEQRLRSLPALREMFENEMALLDYAARIPTGPYPQLKVDNPVAGGWRQWRLSARFFKPPRLMVVGVSLIALGVLGAWFGLTWPENPNPSGPQQAKFQGQKEPGGVAQPTADSQRPPLSEPNSSGGPAESKKGATAKLDQNRSAPGTVRGTTAIFLLLASGTRGEESLPLLEIPAWTKTVQLELEAAPDDCATFSAILKTESDKEIQRWESLRARRDHSTLKVARLRIPASYMKNAGYVMRLECVSGVKNPASAAQYRFKVKKNIS